MVHILAIKLTESLIHNNIAAKEKKAHYIYGIEVAIEKIITYLIIVSLAVILGVLIPSICFLVFFLALRGRTGGYHAESFMKCLLSSLAVYLFCAEIGAPFLISHVEWMRAGVIGASCIICAFAPVNHPNLQMSEEEIKYCRKSARVVLLLELLCFLCASLFQWNEIYIVYSAMGIILCGLLLGIAKLLKQEVTKDENQ